MQKKLYRVRNGKVLTGVCAGVAKYFDLDPTVVRVVWAVGSLFVGAGILAYIVCAFVIPEEPNQYIDV